MMRTSARSINSSTRGPQLLLGVFNGYFLYETLSSAMQGSTTIALIKCQSTVDLEMFAMYLFSFIAFA